jgi:arylformamidase
MRLVDLTHPISADMPVYPGTEAPLFQVGCSLEEHGFAEKKISLYSHTGTHIDAPAHLLKDYKTLDQLPIDHFYGKALVISCENTGGRIIEIGSLEPYKEKIKDVDFLLIHTGWGQYWGTDRYFTNYQVLSLESAIWLSNFNLKGIGLDTISADSADTHDYHIHKVFLKKNIIIIENMKNLDGLTDSTIMLSCFPLSFVNADGSPVRAVALIG